VDDGWYRLAMVLTLFLGIWEGPIAIIFRLFTDKGPNVMVAANYLSSPWCYLGALPATVVAFAAIAVLETRRKKVMSAAGHGGA
jgi:hypothetical protein